MPINQRYDLTPSSFWELVFRHKKKILFVPLVVGALSIAVILFFPRTYRSEAKLFLQVGRESVGLDPTATTGQTISLMQSNRENEVKSAMDVLLSRSIVAAAVDEIGPEVVLAGGIEASGGKPTVVDWVMDRAKSVIALLKTIDPISTRERAIIEIEDTFKVDAERNSTVLVTEYESKSAAGAQRILHSLIEVYQREHQRIHRNASSSAFFTEQLEILRKQLSEAQHALQETKNQMGLVSVEARKESLEMQLQSLELSLFNAQQDKRSAEGKLEELAKQLESIPERELTSQRKIPNEGADLLRKELYTNQMKLMDLKSRLSEDHPMVVAVASQVDEARKVVENQSEGRDEVTNDINPVYRSLSLDLKQQQSSLASLEERIHTILEQKTQVKQLAEQINRDEVALSQLEREEKLADEKYRQYANNLEQARIDRALEESKVSGISIVQPPTLQEKPVSPSKLILLLASLAATLAGIVSWVFISEKMDNRLRNESEMEDVLGLPVLVSIPESSIQSRILA